MIRVIDVHKSFGTNQVLCGVNLEIPTGSVFAIVGGSGSGKSVLLKHSRWRAAARLTTKLDVWPL